MAPLTENSTSVLPWLEKQLLSVQTPGQYVGGEHNMIVKDPSAVDVRVCLAFPDLYSIGMSHLGLKILYGLLNEQPWIYAERSYGPQTDLEELMRKDGVPLFSWETHTPLSEFDVVGFSLQTELAYASVLWMLELGGIPVRQSERGPEHPLVITGGPVIYNAEPLADFVDLMVLGDGEEALLEVCEIVRATKGEGLDRRSLLRRLVSEVKGLYAPSLYDVAYHEDGTLAGTTPNAPEAPAGVAQTFVTNLDATYFPTRPLVPNTKVIHDRIEIEIMRGCTQGCRFCHAGYTKRPLRHRWPETIVKLAKEIYENTGYDEMALTSLSSADYPYLREVVALLRKEFEGKRVGLSLPSLRVNEQSRDIPRMVGAVRKSGLTFAPEAASQRLRERINKNISDDDLLAGAKTAWEDGWKSIKLYFLIGIPDETDDDLMAILHLADRVSHLRCKVTGQGPGQVNCTISTLVPKPHTPYQWDPMIRAEEVERKLDFLKSNCRNRKVRLKYDGSLEREIEGVLSKGDRRVGQALYEAHKLGCRLDTWNEHFDHEKWQEAFRRAGVDPEWYAFRTWGDDELFPWEHLKPGINRKYLQVERRKALRLDTTTDCREDRCHGCGVDETHCFR